MRTPYRRVRLFGSELEQKVGAAAPHSTGVEDGAVHVMSLAGLSGKSVFAARVSERVGDLVIVHVVELAELSVMKRLRRARSSSR